MRCSCRHAYFDGSSRWMHRQACLIVICVILMAIIYLLKCAKQLRSFMHPMFASGTVRAFIEDTHIEFVRRCSANMYHYQCMPPLQCPLLRDPSMTAQESKNHRCDQLLAVQLLSISDSCQCQMSSFDAAHHRWPMKIPTIITLEILCKQCGNATDVYNVFLSVSMKCICAPRLCISIDRYSDARQISQLQILHSTDLSSSLSIFPSISLSHPGKW